MAPREPLTAAEQSQLLRELSHEMRTPLGAAMIWLRIFQDSPEPAQKLRAMVLIEESLGELNQMAQDVSDCAALMESRLELDLGPTTLDQVLSGPVRSLQSKAASREVTLELDTGPEPLPVRVDRARLSRALGSILAYAIVMHGAGAPMTVGLERSGGDAVVRIPMAATAAAALVPLRDHLRDGLEQSGPSGLALPIAVETIRLHRGTIEPAGDAVRIRIPRGD